MKKSACFFGDKFKDARLRQGISQWQIVHRTGNYLANIQRIEKGLVQPGITLAFKLLDTIKVKPGDFLLEIAGNYQEELAQSVSPFREVIIRYTKPILSENQKYFFGPLLYQARSAAHVSQTAMAKAAGYNLRNINTVEKGMQEPGIITALSLVLSTGAEIKEFFNTLYFWWQEGNPL